MFIPTGVIVGVVAIFVLYRLAGISVFPTEKEMEKEMATPRGNGWLYFAVIATVVAVILFLMNS